MTWLLFLNKNKINLSIPFKERILKQLLSQEDKILRLQAEPIPASEFGSDWLKKLASDLLEIMAHQGAVGVAAPQIGISKRVIVFGTQYTKRRRPEYPIPDTILINPSYKNLSDELQIDYEGCLNCGELMGKVVRAQLIEYTGFDLYGRLITKQASGLEARIIQHEIDHLDGILFIDRMPPDESLITRSELVRQQSAN